MHYICSLLQTNSRKDGINTEDDHSKNGNITDTSFPFSTTCRLKTTQRKCDLPRAPARSRHSTTAFMVGHWCGGKAATWIYTDSPYQGRLSRPCGIFPKHVHWLASLYRLFLRLIYYCHYHYHHPFYFISIIDTITEQSYYYYHIIIFIIIIVISSSSIIIINIIAIIIIITITTMNIIITVIIITVGGFLLSYWLL